MADNARKLVEDVLSPGTTREIWSGNYDKVLPVSVQEFALSSILPAIFYMFRFGQRRGRGNFLKTFGKKEGSPTPSQIRRSATIERIAETLSSTGELDGFNGDPEKAILGDLLLCFCLENVRHSLGRDQQIQRVAPAHYMASWVDLPQDVGHLRFVPEMIVAMLANQKGESVGQSDDKKTWFPVGKKYEENVLLGAFSQGVTREGSLGDWASDRFKEAHTVGLDQLLMIRLAQQLKAAPDKMRGKEGGPISNQRPIAEQAARNFSEDIRRFVRAYAEPVPRHALVEMLESCVAIGLMTILTSTVELLLRWSETGDVPARKEQHPAPLFIDCSNGVERSIRDAAEQSMDDYMRRMERLSGILMVLRLLDYQARNNRKIKKEDIATRPYATDWLNLLGDLLYNRRHSEAQRIRYSIEDMAERLAEKLEDDYPEATEILGNVDNQPNPVWRLADGLMVLMGRKPRLNFIGMIDSSLLTGRPNGLAAKRTTTRGLGGSTTRRRRDVRSLVFTDSVLDYLVHLHLLKSGSKPGVRALSFGKFLEELRERYGFHVDIAPSGMTISNELLQRNRTILERRLRDLGLLVGVNDAEAMKRLEPRFKPVMEN